MKSFGVRFSVLINFPSKTNLSGLKCKISHFSVPFGIWPEIGFISAGGGGACSICVIVVPAFFLCFLPSKCALKVTGPIKNQLKRTSLLRYFKNIYEIILLILGILIFF